MSYEEDELNFCIKFFNKLEPSKKSCIYSPLSILNALAMILAGADGKTAEEILNAISKEKDASKLLDYLCKKSHRYKLDVDKTLSPPAAKKSKKDTFLADIKTFKIIATNGLFMNESAEIVEEYKDVVKEKYGAHLQKLDFEKEKDESVKIINKFVSDATNEKINKVLSADDLDDDTAVVIINAVYFAGKWDKAFLEKLNATFYSNSLQKRHPMMSGYFYNINYTEGDEWECAGIPYKERKIWFFVVLPKKRNGLNDLVKKVDYEMFKMFFKKSPCTLTLTMPIFETEAECDLTKILPQLGIQDLFKNTCNLSKMLKSSQYVSKAVHKAVIKVNEFGTEAAAVTVSLTAPACGSDLHMKVDHPFMYYIVEINDKANVSRKTNLLFAGTYC